MYSISLAKTLLARIQIGMKRIKRREKARRTEREKEEGRKKERERHRDHFYCARMQAEESLGTQCTCSCYIELSSRAPPSRLQSRGGGGGGHHPASQLFYSLLRHRQYCATTIAPTPLPHPSTCFFHLSTATVRAGGAAKLYVAAVAVAPRAMMNSTPLVFSVIPPLPPSRSPLLLTDSLPSPVCTSFPG